jgi:hypothetical protein
MRSVREHHQRHGQQTSHPSSALPTHVRSFIVSFLLFAAIMRRTDRLAITVKR